MDSSSQGFSLASSDTQLAALKANEAQEAWSKQSTEIIKDHMKRRGLRGNPKDFVMMVDQRFIVDWKQAVEVKASLPEKLEPGHHVYVFNRDARLVPVEIRKAFPDGEENSGKYLVWNGASETVMERKDMFPTALPRILTLLHKSKLAGLLGEKLGDMYWSRKTGMRR